MRRASIYIDIEGADRLVADFRALGPTATARLFDPAYEAAKVVAEKAKEKVPVASGKLKSRIRAYQPSKRSKYRAIARVSFSRGAMHGVPLELGHRIMRNGREVGYAEPRPFLRPAADESRDFVNGAIRVQMDRIIKEMSGR